MPITTFGDKFYVLRVNVINLNLKANHNSNPIYELDRRNVITLNLKANHNFVYSLSLSSANVINLNLNANHNP